MTREEAITEAPDKIFCWRGVLGTLFCSLKKGTNTDCTEYIRKDLLLEWAEAHKVNCIGDHYTDGRNDAMDLLIKMLDLL